MVGLGRQTVGLLRRTVRLLGQMVSLRRQTVYLDMYVHQNGRVQRGLFHRGKVLHRVGAQAPTE
jgi:hypothetical protein